MSATAHAVYSPDDGGWYVEMFKDDGARKSTSVFPTKRAAKESALDDPIEPYLVWLKDIDLDDY